MAVLKRIPAALSVVGGRRVDERTWYLVQEESGYNSEQGFFFRFDQEETDVHLLD